MNDLLLRSQCIESHLGVMHCVMGWGSSAKQSRQQSLTSQGLHPSGQTGPVYMGKLRSILGCDQSIEKDKEGGDRE